MLLTRGEQRLLELLPREARFSLAGLAQLPAAKRMFSRGVLKQVVASLARKGKLVRVRKGEYFVAGDGVDELLVAQEAFRGYLGFSTALWMHGIKTETPAVAYVVSGKAGKERKIGGLVAKGVGLGEKAFGWKFMGKHRVSTKAKTLFDCLLKPKYCGGINALAQYLRDAQMTESDWDELEVLLKEYGGSSTIQRAGFVIQKAKGAAPQHLLNWLDNRIAERHCVTVADPHLPRAGALEKKWFLYDNTVA